jgi:hypothetical protein
VQAARRRKVVADRAVRHGAADAGSRLEQFSTAWNALEQPGPVLNRSAPLYTALRTRRLIPRAPAGYNRAGDLCGPVRPIFLLHASTGYNGAGMTLCDLSCCWHGPL